jgi:hypothetical protein
MAGTKHKTINAASEESSDAELGLDALLAVEHTLAFVLATDGADATIRLAPLGGEPASPVSARPVARGCC